MRVSSSERKEQLIAATVELMRREGVQSVTMRSIAREANAPVSAQHGSKGTAPVFVDSGT